MRENLGLPGKGQGQLSCENLLAVSAGFWCHPFIFPNDRVDFTDAVAIMTNRSFGRDALSIPAVNNKPMSAMQG